MSNITTTFCSLAETLDGRKGQIPSNFIERLCGEDLLEFHRDVVLGLAGDLNDPLGQDPWSTIVPTNLPLDPYGGGIVGGMGGPATGIDSSPVGVLGEPQMPYHCKLKCTVSKIFRIGLCRSITVFHNSFEHYC